MDIFVSTYRSKIDEKSRILIPSSFRALIKEDAVFAYCSLVNECIEVCTQERMMQLNTYIERLDMFSPEREALSVSILSRTEKITIDAKGRATVSNLLIEYAKIEKDIVFVGKGGTFEIWKTEAFEEHAIKSRQFVISNKLLLKSGAANAS